MGLPTEILEFFNIKNAMKNNTRNGGIRPFTVSDFCRLKEKKEVFKILNICQKFVSEGLLIHCGISKEDPIAGHSYYNFEFNQDQADYGAYDFMVEGFLSIKNYFSNSVKPIVLDKNDSPDIGTGFVIADNMLVTALHCISNMKNVRVIGSDNKPIKPESIIISENPEKDIAIIITKDNAFNGLNHFKVTEGAVLSEVLTIGYPPISGFEAVQFSEVVTVNLKSSLGNVVGRDRSYLDKQDYLLINARVKGGNSGGPVIDKYGRVIGVLTSIPVDPDNRLKNDILGYGIALPSNEIVKLLSEKENHKELEFFNTEKGFQTEK
jgi:serine protease Do